jgi:hypothetical protein
MNPFSGEFWESVSATSLAVNIRESVWVYPALETTHVLGLALLFGAIATFDLRVLGLNKELSVTRLWHHVKPWVWIGFVAAFSSGVLLFIGGAVDFAVNPAMQAKLLLLLLAGINAATFETRLRKSVATWDQSVAAPMNARTSAALSLALWLLIMIAGRFIAYVK